MLRVFKVYLFYLPEVVVDINVSVSPYQKLDQFVDDGQLPLHHSYMQSSVMNTKKQNRHIKILTLKLKEKYCKVSG